MKQLLWVIVVTYKKAKKEMLGGVRIVIKRKIKKVERAM